MSDLVSVERQGYVLVIGVDRQAKANAWNVEIIAAVAAAYTELHDDPDLRVGVVHVAGKHFSAGLDLPDVLPAVQSGDIADVLPEGMRDPWDFFGEPCAKPIVLAVQGRCYTLGIELALASQATIAANDTVFAQLEVARAIVPLGGASLRLPQLGAIGTKWLLGAEPFSASEALLAGMVTEVVEPGTQLDRAIEVAQQIATNAPLAVQSALAATRAGQRAARDAACAQMRQSMPQLLETADVAEGVAAMMERRPPKFTGT